MRSAPSKLLGVATTTDQDAKRTIEALIDQMPGGQPEFNFSSHSSWGIPLTSPVPVASQDLAGRTVQEFWWLLQHCRCC